MDKKQILDNTKILLWLEWLGIRTEDTKEEYDFDELFARTVYYFSVPESSTIEIEDNKLNDRIKTSDGLKLVAKEALTEMLIDCCQKEYPGDEEFIEDVKNDISNYFKFRAKVRNGEIWNKEMGDKRVEELIKDIQKAAQYSEV